ncbi:MAG: helix-turn-helix domain-containing protein [Muribaculaceae bacterium]
MDESLYHYSLAITMTLMTFFGLHMLLARVPERKIFANFLLSRRLMGVALLILVANYSVHLFCTLRLKDVYATILMNLGTYFICYWLFSSAMITLLDNRYLTRKLFCIHLGMWVVYESFAVIASLFLSDNVQKIAIIILALWLITYGLFLSVRILRKYYQAVKMFEETHSDEIEAYIQWMSVFTYWAVGFGVGCGLLTFLQDEYIFIWILASIPFYVYLYCCYQNYLLFYEQVEIAIMEEEEEEEKICSSEPEDSDAYRSDISAQLESWVTKEGFSLPGVTLKDLAAMLGTNRTYLSEYINAVYHKNFRGWITDLRIEYSKHIMLTQPDTKILEISELSGFLSHSHFSKKFAEKEGCTPARWREEHTSK